MGSFAFRRSAYVEALAASAGTPIGRMVPIDRLDPNPNQPRQVMGDLSDLIASISVATSDASCSFCER